MSPAATTPGGRTITSESHAPFAADALPDDGQRGGQRALYGVVTYNGWDTNVWNFGSETDLPQLKSNPNSDLNLKPYIGGLGERTVRVAPPGVTTLAFEADDAASAGVNATFDLVAFRTAARIEGFCLF